jgi:hypothetical protein
MPDDPAEELSIDSVKRPEAKAVKPKDRIRVFLAIALTVLVVALFIGFGVRMLFFSCPMDPANRETITHLFELLLVTYGTVLGFYFGTQD